MPKIEVYEETFYSLLGKRMKEEDLVDALVLAKAELDERVEGEGLLKIELIADAEVASAVKEVLAYQYATPVPDLVVRTARLLGFSVTTTAVKSRLEAVIQALLASEEIVESADGVVDLVDP